MDSQDRDESRIRRRQELLARRVGEALNQLDAPQAGQCPDGEILAAYAEQGLSKGETEKWENHFATCSRCRKILLVLAASADTPLAEKEVARLGELVSAARGAVEISGRTPGITRPKRMDWRVRWLAPALGVAAMLAVWFAARPPWRTTDRSVTGTLIAQAPKQELPVPPAPSETDRLSTAAPSQDQKTETAPSSARASEKGEPSDSAAREEAARRADRPPALDRISPSFGERTNSDQPEKKLRGPAEGRQLPPASPQPTAPAPPPAAMPAPAASQSQAKAASNAPVAEAMQAQASAPAAGNGVSRDIQAETVQGGPDKTGAGASQQSPAPAVPFGARKAQALAVLRPLQKDSSLLKAPNGSLLWRAGKGGTIERSADGGASWVLQSSPSTQDWLAGAAVSDTVCWLAGRNGAIAKTSDGQHWELIAPPTPAGGNGSAPPDWTNIAASDAQTATITANDGRRFATIDGGKTWRQP